MNGAPAFEPWTIETVKLKGHKPIRVGTLGLTTPGSAIWDRDKVGEVLDFAGGVETAEVEVPKLITAGQLRPVPVGHGPGAADGPRAVGGHGPLGRPAVR